MLLFGFELEGFALTPERDVCVPRGMPVDGFPGLVELRTTGGKSLEGAYAEIVQERLQLQSDVDFGVWNTEYKFSGADMAYMRKHCHFEKRRVDVMNIYGKAPKRLGNRTLASLQINISNRIRENWRDDKGVYHADEYGLLDVYGIVKRLDQEFAREIKATGRQPGMYAIKDDTRLEYRSLPNSVWSFDIRGGKRMLDRIRSAVMEGH